MRRPVLIADLTTGSWRQRWPRFTAAALDVGVRAVFALPLHSGGVRHDGALALYRRAPGPLSSADWVLASAYAAAANELLTLEHHALDLAGFADEWRGTRPENSPVRVRPAVPVTGRPTTGRVLLACWFGPHQWRPVRERVTAVVVEQGLRGDDVQLLVVAVHEAVSNVVNHGGGHGQLLLWCRDGHLWCEISDHGPGVRTGALDPEHSPWRGVNIIRKACASVAVTSDATGTRVLLTYPIGPTATVKNTGVVRRPR